MKINIELKHIIIPLIVLTITIIGLNSNLNSFVNNTQYDIVYIYNDYNIKNDSKQKGILEDLVDIQTKFNQSSDNKLYNTISLKSFNNSKVTANGIDNISRINDLVIIYGDYYNEDIYSIIKSDAEFILIDNSLQINKSNVININDNNKNNYFDENLVSIDNKNSDIVFTNDDFEFDNKSKLDSVIKGKNDIIILDEKYNNYIYKVLKDNNFENKIHMINGKIEDDNIINYTDNMKDILDLVINNLMQGNENINMFELEYTKIKEN